MATQIFEYFNACTADAASTNLVSRKIRFLDEGYIHLVSAQLNRAGTSCDSAAYDKHSSGIHFNGVMGKSHGSCEGGDRVFGCNLVDCCNETAREESSDFEGTPKGLLRDGLEFGHREGTLDAERGIGVHDLGA